MSGTVFAAQTELTVATVNNSDMITLQRLSSRFEEQHPDIHINWVVLEENVLRQRVTTDVTTGAAQFDLVTVSNYETSVWSQKGLLHAYENLPASYDTDDLLQPIRETLSFQGKLYGLPFNAESTMTYYRRDLFEQAGLTMPEQPTYEQVRSFAEKLTNKEKQIYGLCLRGKPGWGENMSFITPLVTAFGGQWFDLQWHPQLDRPQWQKAITYYSEALKHYGPPGATSNGFNENLTLFATGHCAMWIDATVAAGLVYDPKQSQVSERVGFAPMPAGDFTGGPTWLGVWNFAVPAASHQKDAARSFAIWATSKEYIRLVAQDAGWVSVPPGTRRSTYENTEYQKAAPFAAFVLQAINTANPEASTQQPRPYRGAQFVAIPEYQGIGTQVGQGISSTLTGEPVDKVLRAAQAATTRTMRQARYGQ